MTLLSALGGAGAAYSAVGDGGSNDPAPPLKTTATAKVTQADMVVTDTVDGTLGYGQQTKVVGKRPGTITGLATEGSVVRRGQRLFALDGQPVFLMYGKVPAYRDLTVGTKGADVRQLERNLKALGYGAGLEVDDTYTSYTAQKVREWQEDRGLPETGSVELGSVLFSPGPVRVAGHEASVGDETGPGQPVLTISSLQTVVNVDLPVARRPLARKGVAVKVTLPDGTTVDGRVASVGTVAKTSKGDEQGGGGETTIEVRVSLSNPGLAGGLDAAPVEVTFESERRKNVLSVPVNALLALPSGGYGVVVVEGTKTRTVKVTLGVFADGRVEVSAKGLSAGMDVEVPAS
jgi:peptidoglycan hydrolase-like protein with peptidoglycan-binding domain